jgi:protein-disulfide isomerase
MQKLSLTLMAFGTLALMVGEAPARQSRFRRSGSGFGFPGLRGWRGYGSGGSASRPVLKLSGAPAKGSEEALVTVILFHNFRCSYGNYVFNAFHDMQRDHPGTFRLYFKHHAINRYKRTALLAAQAAMAAHAQFKFWDMAEILFRNRNNINSKNLETYAQEIGMKLKPYKAAMRKGTYRSRVEQEVTQSKRFLKGSTKCPVVWINGKQMSGYISTWRLKSMLRKAAREVRGIRIRPLL